MKGQRLLHSLRLKNLLSFGRQGAYLGALVQRRTYEGTSKYSTRVRYGKLVRLPKLKPDPQLELANAFLLHAGARWRV